MRVHDYEWIWMWSWSFGNSEVRIEINPLSWMIGVMMAPLGARFDIGPVGLGVAWGPYENHEEHERAVLDYLKRKYDR